VLGVDVVLPFLFLVAIGAAVQSITGFAMGLIIMGGVTALGLADIAFSAAVVSLISMVNTSVALRHTYKFIDPGYWRRLVSGLLPMTVAGVALLHFLSQGFYGWLKVLLGIVIIAAGTLLMLKPAPWETASSRTAVIATGCAGGLIGGLYGAGGAPLAYFMYRQPLQINAVRATLLATFLTSTAGRTLVIGVSGQFVQEMFVIAVSSIPVVVIVTLISTRLAHLVPDRVVRRFVFLLLILLGGFLIVSPAASPSKACPSNDRIFCLPG